MSPTPHSLPQGCVLRSATKSDRFALQALVYRFIRQEAWSFEVRIVGYSLLQILMLSGLIWLESFLFAFSRQGWVQLGLFFAILATMIMICLEISFLLLHLQSSLSGAFFHWSNYTVIEHQGRLIGCGALAESTLCSIIYNMFVDPEWRGKGLGSELMHHLLAKDLSSIYLVCKPDLVPFYQAFGFSPMSWYDLPDLMKLSFEIFRPSLRLRGYPLCFLVLHPNSQNSSGS